MTPSPRPSLAPKLEQLFEAHIQSLATTLSRSTTASYRVTARRFLAYLHASFPRVRRFSQLRRDPHLLGWFRCLCEQTPPLSNHTRQIYLLSLRRLLLDFAYAGYPLQPGLILPEDFPPLPQYLPRALSSEEDQRLQQELRQVDNLPANALLLTRATGMRIGECINLSLDCLRPLGEDQWALHVPLGKLHTERLVPADENVRQIVTRILALRDQAPASRLTKSAGLLLPRSGGFYALYQTLSDTLIRAAERAACSQRVTPHRLRHSFASEMLRLGVSLPALMQLLGHKDIRMTLRYLQITQQDLQREFLVARQNASHSHLIPKLAVSGTPLLATADIPGIRHALTATRHLLEMYRRQLADQKSRRKLQLLDKRLLTISVELNRLATSEK